MRSVFNRSLVSLFLLTVLIPVSGLAQSDLPRLLIPPLQTADGVNRGFGVEVAREVRSTGEKFAGLRPFSTEEMEDAYDQYAIERDETDRTAWRRLAHTLKADVILFGTATRTNGEQVTVDVQFWANAPGHELNSYQFTVSGDGDQGRQAAIQRITDLVSEQVTYQRSLLFCEDYFGADQIEDALRNCNQALKINSNSTRAHEILAQIHEQRENWGEAGRHYQAVLDNHSKNIDAMVGWAQAASKQGKHDQALKLYDRYMSLNPDDAKLRLNVASRLATAGGIDQAMQLVREGIKRDSTNADFWATLGDLAYNKAVQSSNTAADSTAWRTAVTAYQRAKKLTEGLSAEKQQHLAAAQRKLASGGKDKASNAPQGLQWSGTGDKTTQTFTAPEPGWRIEWVLRGGEMSSISILVKNAETGETVTTASSNAPGQQRSFVHQAGSFYLEIIAANARWTVRAVPGQDGS